MSAHSSGREAPGLPGGRSALASWAERRGLRLGQGRAREWCERNIPTLSRPFLKYGRDAALGPLFALLSLFSFGRWWDWSQGRGPMGAAAAWTAAAAVPLLTAKRWWFVAMCPFAWIGGQSYFHFLVDRSPLYLLVGTASFVAAALICGLGIWLDPRRED